MPADSFINTNLSFCDIDENWKLVIDADNLFWSLIRKNKDSGAAIEKDVIPLYEGVKKELDEKMRKFRSDTELTSVYINPTDRCNAECSYCYVPLEMRKTGSQMDTGRLEYVLKKSIEYFRGKPEFAKRKPVIIFHASEPLLVKEMIFDLILRFREDLYFGIQTNAVLFEKEDVDFLKKYKVSVGISLDSPDLKINDSLRHRSGKQGTFNKVIRVIDWFDGYTGLSVLSTITKYNVEQLAELVDFLAHRKVKSVLLNPLRCTNEEVLSLRPDDQTLFKHFIKAVEKAIELSKSSNRVIIGNFANIIIGIIAPEARRLMCDITPCGGARSFVTVTASGDFIPCGEFVGLNEFRAGNIFSLTIKEAMSSQAFNKVRSRVVEKIEECDLCLFRNICGAPCPAEVYSLSKNLYQISPYCEFYKKLIKYAFKLIAEDKVKYIVREDALKNLEYEYNLVK